MTTEWNPHQLPHIEDVRHDYHELGASIVLVTDAPPLEKLLNRAKYAVGPPHLRSRYFAWLNYELGLAWQAEQPERAFGHFLATEAHLRHGPIESPHREFETARSLALVGLLRSRLDRGERTHQLQKRATVAELGRIIVQNSTLMTDASLTRDEFDRCMGEASEAAMAGAFLSMEEDTSTFIPAPASPRQNSPHTGSKCRADSVPESAPMSKAFDYSLFLYRDSDERSADVTPLQIKTIEKGPGNVRVYDPSIAVLYSNRDLFVDKPSEFASFGQSLITYAHDRVTTRQLAIAHSNLGFALELHAEDLAHTTQ